ncbi:mannose-6-phosphate isomerase, class I [Veronia nyctiphanis]|uniref:mannose-6-phosphate isomerase, class I n=1 Tax=Veronia nyctiphanis TaxID=1278244 RepID=UPI002E25597A
MAGERAFYVMDNVIQHYAWGSKTALPSMLGVANTSKQPLAEMWMGAHPKGSSMLTVGHSYLSLHDFIASDRYAVLGESLLSAGIDDLPFLFKILAAENALSIQVHPNKRDAEIGFNQEEQAGIALNDPARNYKDANHKPELVYALTPYEAMNGFRPLSQIFGLFKILKINSLQNELSEFEQAMTPYGLKSFFKALLSLPSNRKEASVHELMRRVKQYPNNEVSGLIRRLAVQYPSDVGLFAPLLMNVVNLRPGEAMFLSANTPHAYVHGVGLEIMANSDNVLRAGLTSKHIDVKALIDNTHFIPKLPDSLVLEPENRGNVLHYPVPVSDFKFSIYREGEHDLHTDSAEIILAVEGELLLTTSLGEVVALNKGQSVFIPAYVAITEPQRQALLPEPIIDSLGAKRTDGYTIMNPPIIVAKTNIERFSILLPFVFVYQKDTAAMMALKDKQVADTKSAGGRPKTTSRSVCLLAAITSPMPIHTDEANANMGCN